MFRSIFVLIFALMTSPALAAPNLSAEPAGRDAPDRTVDIQHLVLELTVDLEAGRLEGSATLTVRPLRAGLKEIVLHQVGLDVLSTTVDGAETPFVLGPTTMGIAVDSPAMGSDLTVTVRYAAEPTLGMHFRRPGPDSPDTYTEVWTQGENIDNRHWIPVWDFPTDRFTYEGRFTVENRFTALSNGVLESKTPASRPGWTTWRFALRDQDLVAYLVMFAAAEYRVITDEWRGRSVGYYVSPGTTDEETRLLLGKTPRMLEWMSTFLGVEYPYPVYNQVTVQRFIYTAMENTTATVHDRRLLLKPAPHRPARYPESVVAHELAHHWFGDQLTLRTWSHMWLNEGLTSWLTDEWLRMEFGEDRWADSLHSRYERLVKSDDRKPFPMVGTFYNRTDDRNHAHVYTKGATAAHMLRVLMGDEAFFRGMNLYLTRHQHGLVETDDLRRALEDASGIHLRWFFDQWVYSAGHPKLAVSHEVDAQSGRVRIAVEQTQSTDGLVPTFHVPLDLEVATSTGITIHRVVLDGSETAISLDLAGAELRYVGVDPFAGVLMDLDQKQTAGEWTAQLQSPNAYTRRRAIAGLATLKRGIPEATRNAIETTARDMDAPDMTRTMAATVLAAWRDERSTGVLLDVLAAEPRDGVNASLRTAIVEGLGKAEATPKVVAALTKVLDKDVDDWTRTSSMNALAALEERRVRPRALAALRGRASEGYWVQGAAATALGTWGEASDMRALKKFFAPEAPFTRPRHQALRAGAKLASRQPVGPERDRAREPVRDAAESWLDSLHLRDRQVALGVLGQVGDRGSIQRIEELLHRDRSDAIQRQGPSTIETIRTRTEDDAEAATGEVTAKLKKLQETVDELTKELKDLQERR